MNHKHTHSVNTVMMCFEYSIWIALFVGWQMNFYILSFEKTIDRWRNMKKNLFFIWSTSAVFQFCWKTETYWSIQSHVFVFIHLRRQISIEQCFRSVRFFFRSAQLWNTHMLLLTNVLFIKYGMPRSMEQYILCAMRNIVNILPKISHRSS